MYSRLIEALCPDELDQLLAAVKTFRQLKEGGLGREVDAGWAVLDAPVGGPCVRGGIFSAVPLPPFSGPCRGFPFRIVPVQPVYCPGRRDAYGFCVPAGAEAGRRARDGGGGFEDEIQIIVKGGGA